jgi:hypothetical protein
MKHKNIGATVALLKGISKIFPEPSKEGIMDKICRVLNHKMKHITLQQTEESLAELFMLESRECDYKVNVPRGFLKENMCTFHAEEDLEHGDSFTTPKCMIANCPLDKEE